jgi:hypothetical protein
MSIGVARTKTPQIEWVQMTSNCFSARLPHGAEMSVERNRSWRRIGIAKPWRIRALGNHWISDGEFETPEEAMDEAERLVHKVALAIVALFEPEPRRTSKKKGRA